VTSPCGDEDVRGDENFAKKRFDEELPFARLGFGSLGLGLRGSGRGPRSDGARVAESSEMRQWGSGAVVLGHGGTLDGDAGRLRWHGDAGLRAVGSRARRHGTGAGVDGVAAGAERGHGGGAVAR
jgi:hypothetical protein